MDARYVSYYEHYVLALIIEGGNSVKLIHVKESQYVFLLTHRTAGDQA
jgi:hypothetical protein